RFLKAQKEFLNGLSRRSFPAKGEGVSSDTPREEHSSLSQNDPQPEGRLILMDSAFVANPVTARNGAAPGVCSSCPPKLSGEGGCRLSIISCLAPYANF
ncbi:MAG: hypothetical protein WC637_04110, partial [Victivallales bacterium]